MNQKQKLFNEFHDHLMEDSKPSEYFNEIDNNSNIFSKVYPFTMLGELKKIEQSPQHHPEGNVWNHTMQVIDAAAHNRIKSREPVVFMWAALLHDLGKAPTTRLRKGRITAYDHDRVGAEMAEEVSIHEIALLGLCDRLGRQPTSEEKILEEHKNIERFVQKCEQFSK